MANTALEALAEVFRQHDVMFIAHYDEYKNTTSLEIKAGGTPVIKVDMVGSTVTLTKHDLAIGIGLSRD